MSNFIVRVELYGNPSEEVYARLHKAMSTKGFSKTFEDTGKTESKGKILELPHAMYVIFSSTATTVQIVELAKQAAATVWKDFAVLAVSSEVRFEYYNLKSPR